MTIIPLIFALLMLNGAFAMAEIALVSVKKSRLQQAAEAGNKRAHRPKTNRKSRAHP